MKKALIIFVAVFAISIALVGCIEPQQYNVTFFSNGETVFSMIASNGSTVMMPQAPTKEGAEFVGWALNGEIVSFPYTITGDTTFNAVWGCEHQWKQESTTSSCDQVGATFFSCEKCGKIKKEDSVKSEHSFELTESVKATCTSGGYDLYECTACGTTEKRNETPRDLSLAGHSFVPETIEPTCTKEGYTDNVCALCGRGDGNRVVTSEKLGHTYERDDFDGETGVETDEAGGTITYHCQECYATCVENLVVIYLDPNGGTLPEGVSEELRVTQGEAIGRLPIPTRYGYEFLGWYEDGNERWEVDRRTKAEYDMEIVALWASVGEIVTVEFYVGADASLEGDIALIEIVKGHKLSTVLSELPTASRIDYNFYGWQDSNGNTVTLATVVSDDLVLVPIWEKIGYCLDGTQNHNWSVWQEATWVTCTEDAKSSRQCNLCGLIQYTVTQKATGHDFSLLLDYKDSDCTNAGYMVNACVNGCDETEKEILDAYGHDFSEWGVGWYDEIFMREATCTEEGYIGRVCFYCGEEELQKTDALGHTWDAWNVVGTCSGGVTKTRECTVCGENETETTQPGEHVNVALGSTVTTTSEFWASDYVFVGKIADGNRETGVCSSPKVTGTLDTITFVSPTSIEKVVLVVNGKGSTSDYRVFDEITNNNYNISFVIYDADGNAIYTSQKYKTLDQVEIAEEVELPEGKLAASIVVKRESLYEINAYLWEVEVFATSVLTA